VRWLHHGQFDGQDQWIIRQMEIPPERLYRPDVSITAWRKLCEQARDFTPLPASPDERSAMVEPERAPVPVTA
jgi:hypothetical protein